MKPSGIIAVIFLIAAIALGIFGYQQTNLLSQTQSALISAEESIATQATQIASVSTSAAQVVLEIATENAQTLNDIRGAAATLQAGSIATRSALNETLEDIRATATEETAANATAVAAASATQAAVATAFDAQSARLDELVIVATESADSLATRSANLAEVETALAQSMTEIAVISADATAQSLLIAPTPSPNPSIATDPTPRGDIQVGTLLLDEDFEGNSSFPEQDFINIGRTQVSGDQYLLVLDENPVDILSVYSETEIDDGFLEIELYVDNCEPSSTFLVEIRTNLAGTAGYAFAIDCGLTNWGIFKRTATEPELLIIEPINIPNLDTAASQILSIEARGNSLSFFINGTRLGGVVDETYESGIIGFSLFSDRAAQLRIDNIHLWELEEISTATTPEPTLVSYDVVAARDTFIDNIPAILDTDTQEWRISSDPQLDGDNINVATVAWLAQGDEENQAVIAVVFGVDIEFLAQLTEDASVALNIVPLEESPVDFPSPNIFGTSADGLEAIWTQRNALARITLFGETVTVEDLLSLARVIRNLLPPETD